MVVLTTRELVEEHGRSLREATEPSGEVWTIERVRDRASFLAALPRAGVLFGGNLTAEEVAMATSLRWLHADYAGVDRLPLAELAAAGIVVTNARGLHADTIADHVMMLVLAHNRHLVRYVALQAAGTWDPSPRARQLAGQTLVVVGLGHLGQAIARRGLGSGMKVLGINRSGRAIPGLDVEVGAPGRLRDFLARADVVALSTPLTSETRRLLGRDEFAAMKPGAYFVNVARGACVDQAALAGALRTGHLGGAGLDVFETEPLPPGDPLWSMPNVILTPHVAGQQTAYTEKAFAQFLENVPRFLAGQPLLHQVDPSRGY